MRAHAAILLLAWVDGTGLAAEADAWTEVKTPDFTVFSDAGEGTAQKTAAEFEQMHAAYAKIWPWAHLAQSKPTVVPTLKNETTLKRWAPGYFVRGHRRGLRLGRRGRPRVSAAAHGLAPQRQERHAQLQPVPGLPRPPALRELRAAPAPVAVQRTRGRVGDSASSSSSGSPDARRTRPWPRHPGTWLPSRTRCRSMPRARSSATLNTRPRPGAPAAPRRSVSSPRPRSRPCRRASTWPGPPGRSPGIHPRRPHERPSLADELRRGRPLADRDKDKPRATEAYAKAVELGSTSACSYYRAAQLGWKPVADAPTLASQRQRLERAIELSPSYANAHSFLADVLVEQGDGPAALEKAQRAVALEPGDSYHRLALAHALNKVGRADEGRKSADLALKLAENEAERSALFSRACEGGEQDACALAKQLR